MLLVALAMPTTMTVLTTMMTTAMTAMMLGTAIALILLRSVPLISLSLTLFGRWPAGYSLFPTHAWSHNVTDVVDAVRLLEETGQFEAVTPTELMAAVAKNVHPEAPAAASKTDDDNLAGTGAGDDPCLEAVHAILHYGTCCGGGGYKVAGHQPVCAEAKKELVKKEV